MARLPTAIDVGEPRGARLSGAGVRPTDMGLSDLAQGLDQVGQAYFKHNDEEAQKKLQAAQAGYEGEFAQRAAGYDGQEPGFANAETARFDAYFKPVVNDPNLSDGLRFAMQKRLDDLKLRAGQRAIGIEAEKRGGVISEQRAALSAQNISVGLTKFQEVYGAAYKQLTDNYDGSTQDLAKQAGDQADIAMAAALDTVPEADRPAFQARMAALRPGLMAQAWTHEQTATQAYVVNKVKEAQGTTTNMVIGNPDAYSLASATSDELLAGIPKAVREPMLHQYQAELAAARIQGLIVKGDLDTASQELKSGQYAKILTPEQTLQLTEATQRRSAKLAQDLIEALRYGDIVDPAKLKRAAADSGDEGLQAKANWALDVGAYEGEALGGIAGGAGKKGFADNVQFVLGLEVGPTGKTTIQNDNGHGVSKFGINQDANPDLNVAGLTQAGAIARYRKYWITSGASQLPPGLGLAAFDAAVLFGPDDARKWTAESQGDVGQFFALEQAKMRQLAQDNPAKYGDDLKGWLNRVEKVRAEAARQQAFANVQDGLTSDPIKFALGGGGRAPLAAVPPLPQSPTGPAFQAALQGRLAVGQMMAQRYRAPLRMLTDGEVAQYKDAIGRDPLKAIDLAEQASAAIGPSGARALMGELGQKGGDADFTVHLGDLTAMGLGDYARRAARGQQLQSEGQHLDPKDKTDIAKALDDRANIFVGQVGLRAIVQQTAEAAMVADKASGQAGLPWAYVNSALGANRRGNTTFGGVVRLNGRDTVIPPWLAADHADDALDVMAHAWEATGRGPVYTNGQPVPAQRLKGMQLQQRADGLYVLRDDRGVVMQTRDGRPFAFNMDDARQGLRAHLGAAFVAGDR